MASGSVSSTNLGVDASTGAMAKFVLLPLIAPSLQQQLNVLAILCERARHQGEPKVPTVQDVMQSSDRLKSLLGQLSNYRLLSHVIALLGGCNLPGDVGGWNIGKQLPALPMFLHKSLIRCPDSMRPLLDCLARPIVSESAEWCWLRQIPNLPRWKLNRLFC